MVLIFSRQKICLRTTKLEEMITHVFLLFKGRKIVTSVSSLSNQNTNFTLFFISLHSCFVLFCFSKVKDVKESLQSSCFKIEYFSFSF